MHNMGEKHAKFRSKEGMKSIVVFQVTYTRKPVASESRIVNVGNKVVLRSGPELH